MPDEPTHDPAHDAVIDESRRIEEDAIHSAKGHFEAARVWRLWHWWIGIPTTVIAAAASVTALNDFTIVSGVLALLVAITSALFTFVNPNAKADKHLKAGNAYKALHNDTRIFHRVQCQEGLPVADLRGSLKELNDLRNSLNMDSPPIPRLAFNRAKRGIKAGEAAYAVDGPVNQ